MQCKPFRVWKNQLKAGWKSVLRVLACKISLVRYLVPVEEVVEMKAGQKTISERRLYPGYVLVQMNMTDESWHLVKSTPRVTSFIGGSAQKPTPIKDKEVEIILQSYG
jgi:transcription termination/antitermination protein NusG